MDHHMETPSIPLSVKEVPQDLTLKMILIIYEHELNPNSRACPYRLQSKLTLSFYSSSGETENI